MMSVCIHIGLQVSRQHPEQCDAESVLLRAGALDDSQTEIPSFVL